MLFSILKGDIPVFPPDFDYHHFILLLKRQKLLPLAESILDLIPDNVKPNYRAELQQWTIRSMILFEELKSTNDMLINNGIEPTVLKGPTLSFQLYNEINKRQFSDLDILIDKTQFRNGVQLLISSGYTLQKPNIDLNSNSLETYINKYNAVELYDHDKRILVELHCGIYALGWLSEKDSRRFLMDPHMVTINGNTYQTLNNSNYFLYLCYHGAKHMFTRLSWLRDVADFLKNKEIDHKAVLNMAMDLKIERLLGISLMLVNEYFSEEFPKEYDVLFENDNYYRRVSVLNIRIIRGAGLVEFNSVIDTWKGKNTLPGINRVSLLDWMNQIVYQVFYRQGFIRRLKYYLVKN